MNILKKIYFVLTVVLLADAFMYISYGISLRGHLGDWLLFWTWLILTPIVITINFRQRWTRFYAIGLIAFTILTMLPMMIPFLTIIGYASRGQEKRYRVTDRIDFHELPRNALGRTQVVAIKSFGPIEKIVAVTGVEFEINDQFYSIHDTESIKILNENSSDSLRVEFKFKDGTVKRTM